LWVALAVIGCAPQMLGSGSRNLIPGQKISVPKQLPEEMTPLSEVQVLSRAGLAVLLIMELPVQTFDVRTEMPMVVDISDHWARNEVLISVELGLMPVFSNHRFQPDQPVTRGEMAQVLSKVMAMNRVGLLQYNISSELPADLPRSHLYYPAVRRVLEAGVMELDSAGRFSVADDVSGMQALSYLQETRRLLKSGEGSR
jgi:hypothetical protein